MGVYDTTLGALLISTYCNNMLYVLVLLQAFSFYNRYPTEGWPFRSLVAFFIIVDTVSLINDSAVVYLYTVSHWGELSYLAQQPVQIPIYAATTGVSVLAMHIFLIWRYAVLSKKWPIAVMLLLMALTSAVGDALSTWCVSTFSAISDRGKLKTFVTIWLSLSAATDICVASSLIWELGHLKSTFSDTRSLVRRLIAITISTGSATSVLAVLTLVTYLASPMTNICVAFAFCIGRVCSLTVLYNLNMRQRGRAYTENGEPTDRFGGGIEPNEINLSIVPGPTTSGINVAVHKTAMVHIDKDRRSVADSESKLDAMIDDKTQHRSLGSSA